MKRPALFCLIILIISIAITKTINILFALIFLLGIFLYSIFKKKELDLVIVITIVLCIFCCICTFLKLNKESSLYEYDNITIDFTGVLLQPVKAKDDYDECVFKIYEAPFNSTDEKILIRLYDYNKVDALQPGEVYNIKTKIQIPSAARNPGGFDYSFYLKCKGIYVIGKSDYVDIEFIRKSNLPFFMDDIYKIRASVINTLYNNLSDENAGLITSILFGTNDLDADMLDNFRKAGVAHILAVSGLHVSIICYITNFILEKLKLNRKLKYCINTVIPYFYLMLTGFGVSILRACLMNSISITAKELKKRNDILNSLCISALITLIINPLYLFNVSFQLSYACVLSIALFGEFISVKIKRLKVSKFIKYILSFIGFNISVNMLLIPLSAYYFNNISTISVIANFLIVPLLTSVMFIVLFALVCTPLIPVLGTILFQLLGLILTYIKTVPYVLTNINFSSVNIPTPPLYLIFLYYLLVFTLFGYISLKNKTHLKIFISILLCIIALFGIKTYKYSGDKIYFLDVGQGDCALIHAYGETILIDTGKNYNLENVLLPFLYETSTYKIDKVIITHADTDHSGCISELMKYIKIDAIYFNKCDNPIYYEVTEKAKIYGIEVKSVYANDKINDWIDVISPMRDYSHSNNNSIVLNVKIHNNSILFLADIEKSAIEDLISYNQIEKCDIVKCMHHGAAYENSEELYNILHPETAVISVGENSYGLPTHETYSTLYDLGTRIYRTDDSGCLIINFDKSNYEVSEHNK